MASEKSNSTDQDRVRATALRQAKDIEDRKNLQARIADLVVEAFDLPSRSDADPANPDPSDASLFRHSLSLFQDSDLDDLIYERNVDNRCGYALCPRPNQKLAHGGEKVWNQKGGKDFKLINRTELEKWCSKSCQERTAFVRAQLGTEPAWLRIVRAVDIKLLDEADADNLAKSFKMMAIARAGDDDLAEKMKALALERGELNIKSDDSSVDVVERSTDKIPEAPTLPESQRGSAVEGHEPRQVRFSTR
ncbi:hypothetical protein PV04_05883 [Phialophora macrospora]|uniref:RNA polymerase II subunit B1 CTD phosphatase RPAP2 homolog n=1 Tax=Phialophora macrospora TaxID=1851006 RepID=A0A0D2CN04_9EURO|nr:hypothetical protein PV04_05883 [Phialophora macrospora]